MNTKLLYNKMKEFGFLVKNVCIFWEFIRDKILVVDQPNFNFGHYVVFGGGIANFFDTTTSKWTELGEFNAISNEENQAEVLFVFRAQIFLLLYVHFGDLLVKSLYKFTAESKKFDLVGEIEVGFFKFFFFL